MGLYEMSLSVSLLDFGMGLCLPTYVCVELCCFLEQFLTCESKRAYVF